MTALIQITVKVIVHLAGFTNSLIIEDSVTILTATSTLILVSHAIPIVFFICVWRTFTSVTIPIRNLKFIYHVYSISENLGDKNTEITRKNRILGVPRKSQEFLWHTPDKFRLPQNCQKCSCKTKIITNIKKFSLKVNLWSVLLLLMTMFSNMILKSILILGMSQKRFIDLAQNLDPENISSRNQLWY